MFSETHRLRKPKISAIGKRMLSIYHTVVAPWWLLSYLQCCSVCNISARNTFNLSSPEAACQHRALLGCPTGTWGKCAVALAGVTPTNSLRKLHYIYGWRGQGDACSPTFPHVVAKVLGASLIRCRSKEFPHRDLNN